MLRTLCAVLVLMVLAGSVSGAVSDLRWLAGHWCGINKGIANEEVWLAPGAGSLIGMHRDSKDGELRGLEKWQRPRLLGTAERHYGGRLPRHVGGHECRRFCQSRP